MALRIYSDGNHPVEDVYFKLSSNVCDGDPDLSVVDLKTGVKSVVASLTETPSGIVLNLLPRCPKNRGLCLDSNGTIRVT